MYLLHCNRHVTASPMGVNRHFASKTCTYFAKFYFIPGKFDCFQFSAILTLTWASIHTHADTTKYTRHKLPNSIWCWFFVVHLMCVCVFFIQINARPKTCFTVHHKQEFVQMLCVCVLFHFFFSVSLSLLLLFRMVSFFVSIFSSFSSSSEPRVYFGCSFIWLHRVYSVLRSKCTRC